MEILRQAGLIVEDLVVLIERGEQGRRDMLEAGINLYAWAQVQELFAQCRYMNKVSEEKLAEMEAFVQA